MDIKKYLLEFSIDSDPGITSLVKLDLKGKLFLGGLNSIDEVEKHDIKLIISLAQPPKFFKERLHFRYFVKDDSESKTLSYFEEILPETALMIHECLISGVNVLVHCTAGISRSTTVVLYYLKKYHHENLMESLIFLKKYRPCVFPNSGFIDLLV